MTPTPPPHDPITVGGLVVTFLLEGAETNRSLALFELLVSPGAGMPLPHSHDGYEETIYGLAGTLTFTVEGVARAIGPGDAVCVQRGEVHAFANDGDVASRTLVTITPGILEPAFFREIGGVLADAQGGRPDRGRLGEVMARHGLTPAAPPPA